MTNRYSAIGAGAEFEPGSDGAVLRNQLGITSSADMDELELHLLAQLYEELLVLRLPDRRLDVQDLKSWHRRWLGNVYAWAGQERSVNLGKGGFQFAAATQIQRLLALFEHDCLHRWTPCAGLPLDALTQAIAVTHVELILIHPFREGNGRLSRLLADVMAVQAGLEPLDYSAWERDKPGYVQAIHAGLAGDYEPMRRCVAQALADGQLSAPA